MVNRSRENFTIQELQFLRLIVSQLAPLLDNFRLLQHMQKLSLLEEKNRIARDLHDGLLQSLAGLDLRLAACRKLFSDAPGEIRLELEALQRHPQWLLEAKKLYEALKDSILRRR